eukprot:gnl/TRDRNA2_/TRDRNA2_150335_c2_seq1.p1 gnl/TRDRNA2_/TRDRNA2_150335_c2~~gnl/TRDRNA2_/TRDRNA2_150335_c2_seq1.p1  ORF type:complete len:202 (-),score=35.24 gnl/TRDRNA2_/TRDRNA2_150335_c2_seq1:154-729(-)
MDRFVDTEIVEEGMWISEPIVWVSWMHLGDLLAACESQLIVIDAKQFADVVARVKVLVPMLRSYAELYVQELNKLRQDQLTDLLHCHISSQELAVQCGYTTETLSSNSFEEDNQLGFGQSMLGQMLLKLMGGAKKKKSPRISRRILVERVTPNGSNPASAHGSRAGSARPSSTSQDENGQQDVGQKSTERS